MQLRHLPGDQGHPVGDSAMLPVGPAPDVDDLTVKSGHRRFKRTALVALGTWNLLVLILLLAVVVERNTSEVGSAFKTLALLGVLDAFVLGNAVLESPWSAWRPFRLERMVPCQRTRDPRRGTRLS